MKKKKKKATSDTIVSTGNSSRYGARSKTSGLLLHKEQALLNFSIKADSFAQGEAEAQERERKRSGHANRRTRQEGK